MTAMAAAALRIDRTRNRGLIGWIKDAARAALRLPATTVVLLLCGLLAGNAQTGGANQNLSEIESLIQQGRWREARTEVQGEIQQHPSSVEAYNLLGIIESGRQDFPSALAAFQKALQLRPNSTKTRNNLANVYIREQRPDLAEKEFRTVLRLDPRNRDANYDLGVLLMARKAPEEAIPYFERVEGANVPAQLNLIRACLEAKRTAEALRVATQLSEKNSDSVQVHFSLGVLLSSEKQYKPGLLELEKADALQPETFEILYNLGQALLRDGDNSKADAVLNRALRLKPDSAETMYLLAQDYRNESRSLDALDLLIHAHKVAPQNTDVTFLMAQISMSQDYFEDAIPLLESAIQVAPQRIDLRAALGEAYFISGKTEKAIDEFQQLLQLDKSARSYAFLGLSYRDLGRFDDAKKYFELGLKLDPHSASCLFNLGYIAERQGNSATAERLFQQTLSAYPDFPDALLELANLDIVEKKFTQAEPLLRKFVKVSKDPGTGYYKLAMVERSLHENDAAERDLNVFKTLSKSTPAGPYPYQHLFDYLDQRAQLGHGAQQQLDLTELADEVKKHPDQPQDLYMLAEAYLRAGDTENARATVAELDKVSASDFRTMTGVGVLLARHHLYDDAVQHFQAALRLNPGSDDVIFDLADAYFRERQYAEALEAAKQVSERGQSDDAYLELLGDIYTHLGDTAKATQIFEGAIRRNPDNDQYYLSLALTRLRENDIAGAKQILLRGQARIPASGKLFWGLGLAAALEGNTQEATRQLERAVELLPEWAGAYSTLGVLYFQTGQIAKAREVLDRFKNSSASGSLDVSRIEETLAQAPATAPAGANAALSSADRERFLQMALSLADRTL